MRSMNITRMETKEVREVGYPTVPCRVLDVEGKGTEGLGRDSWGGFAKKHNFGLALIKI